MTTRLERRAKRQFEKQRMAKLPRTDQVMVVESPLAVAQVINDDVRAALARRRAYAWARSPVGTPYGSTVVTKGVSDGR